MAHLGCCGCADPDDANTWSALQTFSAGIKMAAGSCIQDAGGVDRICVNEASPHVDITGDVDISGDVDVTGHLAVGGSAAVSANILGRFVESVADSDLGAGSMAGVYVNPTLTLSGNRTGQTDMAIGGIFVLNPALHTLGAGYGLNFEVRPGGFGGTITTMFAARLLTRYAHSGFFDVAGTDHGGLVIEAPVISDGDATISPTRWQAVLVKDQSISGPGAVYSLRVLGTGAPSVHQPALLIGADAAPASGYALELRDDLLIGSQYQDYDERATTTDPPSNRGRSYAKDVGGKTHFMWRDSAGTETKLSHPTRRVPLVPISRTGSGNPEWPDAATNTVRLMAHIFDDYAGGGVTWTIRRRTNAGTATTAVMVRDTWRFRDGAAESQLESAVSMDYSESDTNSHDTTIAIGAASVAAGDDLRIDITRNGADAGDTKAGYVDYDGGWIEYDI